MISYKIHHKINNVYNSFESEVNSVINKHVPVKQMYVKKNQVPYMNRELRKAIYNKKMFYTKYTKNKNAKTWEEYRKKRNLVNKLKKKSIIIIFKKGV